MTNIIVIFAWRLTSLHLRRMPEFIINFRYQIRAKLTQKNIYSFNIFKRRIKSKKLIQQIAINCWKYYLPHEFFKSTQYCKQHSVLHYKYGVNYQCYYNKAIIHAQHFIYIHLGTLIWLQQNTQAQWQKGYNTPRYFNLATAEHSSPVAERVQYTSVL